MGVRTSDGCGAGDKYLGIQCHLVSHEWKQRKIVLDFIDVPVFQTAVNLKLVVFDVLRDFDISPKVLGFTVDGAPDMIKFCSDLFKELQRKRDIRVLDQTGR